MEITAANCFLKVFYSSCLAAINLNLVNSKEVHGLEKRHSIPMYWSIYSYALDKMAAHCGVHTEQLWAALPPTRFVLETGTTYKMCSTPPRNEARTSLNKSITEHFSPVIVPVSPANKTPQRGNLTGNPRKVRDSAADVFNEIQAWNGQQLLGVKILNNIVNLKTNSMTDPETSVSEQLYPAGLQEQCNHLEEVCRHMNGVVVALEIIAKEMKALLELEKFQQTSMTPMFLTWPADKYGHVCNEVYLAYKQELEVKQCIKENVAHSKTKEELMLHLATWVHQPYVTSDIELAIESLLFETGHRTLGS